MSTHAIGPLHTGAQCLCVQCGALWPCRDAANGALQDMTAHLGVTLVSALTGSDASDAAQRWLDSGDIPPEAVERLLFSQETWNILTANEDSDTARAWFIGANPLLDAVAPVLAIRDGRFDQVERAALSFADGAWSG